MEHVMKFRKTLIVLALLPVVASANASKINQCKLQYQPEPEPQDVINVSQVEENIEAQPEVAADFDTVSHKEPEKELVPDLYALEVIENAEQVEKGVAHTPNKERYKWFDLKPEAALTDRVYLDKNKGLIFFKANAGSLQSNIRALLSETRSSTHLLWCVSKAHEIYSDYWISAKSTKGLLSELVKNYKTPTQMYAGLLDGQTVAVFYAHDKELDACN